MYDAKAVARMFGKSPRWVYKHTHQLNGFRIGSSIFFTSEGIEHAIQGGQTVEGDTAVQRATSQDKAVRPKAGRRRLRTGGKEEGQRRELAARAGLADFLG